MLLSPPSISPIAAVSQTDKHIVSNDYPLFSFHLCLVPELNAIVRYQGSAIQILLVLGRGNPLTPLM